MYLAVLWNKPRYLILPEVIKHNSTFIAVSEEILNSDGLRNFKTLQAITSCSKNCMIVVIKPISVFEF